MATIRAAWHRTIQTKPYESEKLELAVESLFIPTSGDGAQGDQGPEMLAALVALSRALSEAGDALILERLRAHKGMPASATEAARGAPGRVPTRPPDDPYR